ncbi:MAG TPA: von Willebrand factor type A domain-containing protein, partial [Myxococcales bacterium]|nr:von Willebrand factor type A domain-containing protein [Myxococcales bacterium]
MLRPARLAVLSVPLALVFGACAVFDHGPPPTEPMRRSRTHSEAPEASTPGTSEEYVEEIAVTGSRTPRVEPAPAAPVATTPPPPPPPANKPPAGKKGKEEARAELDRAEPKPKPPPRQPMGRVLPTEKPAEVEVPADEVEGGVEGGEVGGVAGPEGGNTFAQLQPNPFVSVDQDRLSTFAIDVDTASYTLARRYITQGALPPPAAVRVEEYVNYFRYRYATPIAGAFSVSMEGAPSPFTKGHHVLRLGLQGKVVSRSERRPANLVFLVDTSGSMSSEDKLPLAREAVKMAVRNLNENDTVSLVTYAGGVRDVLPPTPASEQARIFAAVDSLQSGGGTAMGSGMELAYKHAVQRAKSGSVSRVIVMTDGDTNIGPYMSADAMLEAVGKY